MISGACTNNGSKIKLSTNRGRITFPWIWGLTGNGRQYRILSAFDLHSEIVYIQSLWYLIPEELVKLIAD
jgi:hypothetical protein